MGCQLIKKEGMFLPLLRCDLKNKEASARRPQVAGRRCQQEVAPPLYEQYNLIAFIKECTHEADLLLKASLWKTRLPAVIDHNLQQTAHEPNVEPRGIVMP